MPAEEGSWAHLSGALIRIRPLSELCIRPARLAPEVGYTMAPLPIPWTLARIGLGLWAVPHCRRCLWGGIDPLGVASRIRLRHHVAMKEQHTPVAVVTGANSGVGFHTSRVLVRDGWHVLMVCRSRERGDAARESIVEEFPDASPELVLCDLSSLDEVVDLADRLAERPRLDALVNNAGLFRQELTHTPDGFEWTLGVNHVAHMLLTLRLEDRLRRPGARIVNVASGGHRSGRLERAPIEGILRGSTGSYSGLQAYGDSKLANILFTRELVRRWGDDGTVALSLHPGVLSSRIWENTHGLIKLFSFAIRPFMEDPEVGGRATAALVTDEGRADDNGAYLKKFKVVEPSPAAQDDQLARDLWAATVEAIRPWLEETGDDGRASSTDRPDA